MLYDGVRVWEPMQPTSKRKVLADFLNASRREIRQHSATKFSYYDELFLIYSDEELEERTPPDDAEESNEGGYSIFRLP